MEFATAVRRHRTIGLCFGPAGVGKTLSARRHAHWDEVEPLIEDPRRSDPAAAAARAVLDRSRTVFHAPAVMGTLRDLRETLQTHVDGADTCIDDHHHRGETGWAVALESFVELLIFDESERLSTTALEFIRDRFDRSGVGVGVILIGTPGMEKRLARHPQLYSRVGFAHHCRPLQGDELAFVLTRPWRRLGLELDAADFTVAQAMASIARITGGNFRLQRLFVQIGRILKINGLTGITDDVIQPARGTLVIGAI